MAKTRKNMAKNNKTKKHRVFKKKDFYSGDGMVTKIWGPVAWTLLHTISFNYPINPTLEQKHQYRDFISFFIIVYKMRKQFRLFTRASRPEMLITFSNITISQFRFLFKHFIY